MKRNIITTLIISLLSLAIIIFAAIYLATLPRPNNNPSDQEQSTSAETEDHTSTAVEETETQDTLQTEALPSVTEEVPTEETKSTPETTSKPEVKPTETRPSNTQKELPIWKTLYSGYIQVYRTKYDHYSLIYVDNDDIPELYMYGNGKSELCAVRDDHMISHRLEGAGGGNYHKNSGNFMNVYAENGYLVMRIYYLTDYFMQTFYGREDKSADPPLYYIENFTLPVSEEEFKLAASEFIDIDNVSFMHENALTYDAILEELSK